MKILTTIALLLSGAPALAAAPEPDPDAAGPASEGPPMAAPTAVKATFSEALALLDEGDLSAGCARLRTAAESAPGTAEARWAEQVARALHGLDETVCGWAAQAGARALDTDGQVELIVSQALIVPAWLTAAPPIWGVPIEGPGIPALTILGGLGLGIGGTYLLTERFPVTRGQALTIYSGQALGTWYGLTGEAIAGGPITGRMASFGTLAGAAGGILVASALKPSEGDAALAMSAARWGTGYGGVAAVFVGSDQAPVNIGIIATGTTVGLAVGSVLTLDLELRRSDVRIIDLGGYAGALTGGVVLLLAGDQGSPELAAGVLGAGVGLGLAAGAVIVKGRHDRRRSMLGGRVLAGAPVPTVFRDDDGQGMPGVVWSGRF